MEEPIDHGVLFTPNRKLELTAYADVEWGCDLDDRKFAGGYCIYLGGNLVSWNSKRKLLLQDPVLNLGTSSCCNIGTVVALLIA